MVHTNAPLRERVTTIEAELPHVSQTAQTASKVAYKAAKDVELLQMSLEGLSTELRQMREMLSRYLQIGSMLCAALVLKITSGNAGDMLSSLLEALSHVAHHAS